MSVGIEVPKNKSSAAPAAMHAVVSGIGDGNVSWKEIADVGSFSSSGAGFQLKRAVPVGRLVSLMLPLPAHLRFHDHDKELYRIWGLVQHCYEVGGEKPGFQVGVAFVGKNPPASYDAASQTDYKICGMDGSGMWKIVEAQGAFKTRRDMRYWKSLDLYLALLDDKQETVTGERTVTENISRSGAAVFTTLDINVGDRVKFISESYDFAGLAVVCNRQTGKDGRPRLHLQFVDAAFPVDSLKLKKDNNGTSGS